MRWRSARCGVVVALVVGVARRRLLQAQHPGRRPSLRRRRRLPGGIPLRGRRDVPQGRRRTPCPADDAAHVDAALRRRRPGQRLRSRLPERLRVRALQPGRDRARVRAAPATKTARRPLQRRDDDCAPGNVCVEGLRRRSGAAIGSVAGATHQRQPLRRAAVRRHVDDAERQSDCSRSASRRSQTCNPVGDSGTAATRRSAATSAATGAPVCDCRGTVQARRHLRSVQFLHSRFSLRPVIGGAADLLQDLPASAAPDCTAPQHCTIAAGRRHVRLLPRLEASVRRGKSAIFLRALPSQPTADPAALRVPDAADAAARREAGGAGGGARRRVRERGRRRVVRQDDAAVHQRAGQPARGVGRSPRSRAPRRLRRAIRASS